MKKITIAINNMNILSVLSYPTTAETLANDYSVYFKVSIVSSIFESIFINLSL